MPVALWWVEILASAIGFASATGCVADAGQADQRTVKSESAPIPQAALSWRSELYPSDWIPPADTQFLNEGFLQDFSYAGYHRGEAALPKPTGPIYNVLDFHADPTGVLDSTASIQEAIDAATAGGGGVVRLPSGIYRIRPTPGAAEALRIGGSGIVLRGDGSGRTFLMNDEADMRGKRIILVGLDEPNGWGKGSGKVQSIASDLLSPTTEIPVADPTRYDPGEWIILRNEVTDAFVGELGMDGVWTGQGKTLGGIMFQRQVVAVDPVRHLLEVDVPIRFPLKVRDLARLYRARTHVAEAGLEGFSIGNREHPGTKGWGNHDFDEPGTSAFQVSGSAAVVIRLARDSWMRDIHTYRPACNRMNVHLLSNGVVLQHVRGITLERCEFQRPQYRGDGGNGYMYRLESANECLLEECIARYCRHGFVFSGMQSSGNVIHGGLSQYSGYKSSSWGSDHHMWLSQSNLVDGVTVDRDVFQAFYRDYGTITHGLTSTYSAFWNVYGLAYSAEEECIVHSQQYSHGFVIGTRGPAASVCTDGDHEYKTAPVDYVEGMGQGDSLDPTSLYLDQLDRRLNRARGR